MKFFIHPEDVSGLKKQVQKMAKHLTTPPVLTISAPTKKLRTVYEDLGDDGLTRRQYLIDVCECECECHCGEWLWVADVHHAQGFMTMCSHKELFKEIPSEFGIDNYKCSFCGSTRSNRSKSHILYNEITKQWAQVGTECVKKVLGEIYLTQFFAKLWDVIKVFGGCGEDNFDTFIVGHKENLWRAEAIGIEKAIKFAKMYRDQYGNIWHKTYWDDDDHKKPGTSSQLMNFYNNADNHNKANNFDISELFASVKYYVENDMEITSEFDENIKSAFEVEYISVYELYLAWFAIDRYEKSLDVSTWSLAVRRYPKYKKVRLEVEIIGFSKEENYYGDKIIVANLRDDDGVRLKKIVAHENVFAPYLQPNGKYLFCAEVRWHDSKTQTISLGGRMSKVK